MVDEILKTRLAEVRRTLDRASRARLQPVESGDTYDPKNMWNVTLDLRKLELQVLNVVRVNWEFLESQFKQDSKMAASTIEKLQERVEALAGVQDEEQRQAELARLWKEYVRVEAEAETLLGEIFELMGGLAFRDRSVDPWLFAVADQLVGWYAQRTSDSWDVVTVPCVRGAVARTLVRIVGLRFPEWSVWALPLTAYEFAYQYLRFGHKAVKVQSLIEQAGVEIEEGERKVLLADAFATFTTGPAYLLAAVGLRLSAEEAHRALVIFRVLEGLDRKGTYDKDFLKSFRDQWEHSPASGVRLEADRVARLERFAEAALKALEISYLETTSYSAAVDWPRAREISDRWLEDYQSVQPLAIPDNPRLKLIDVLNAAWLSRFRGVPEDRLETAARQLCDQMLKNQQPVGTGIQQQQPAMAARSGVLP